MHGYNSGTAAQVPATMSQSSVPRCPCVPALPCPCVPAPVSLHPHVPAPLCPISLYPCTCVSLSPGLCTYMPVFHRLPPKPPLPAASVSLHPCVPPPAPRHLWTSTGDSSVLCPCAQQWLCVPRSAVLAVSCSLGGSGDRVGPGLFGMDPASTRLLGVFPLQAPQGICYSQRASALLMDTRTCICAIRTCPGWGDTWYLQQGEPIVRDSTP